MPRLCDRVDKMRCPTLSVGYAVGRVAYGKKGVRRYVTRTKRVFGICSGVAEMKGAGNFLIPTTLTRAFLGHSWFTHHSLSFVSLGYSHDHPSILRTFLQVICSFGIQAWTNSLLTKTKGHTCTRQTSNRSYGLANRFSYHAEACL
jgi:hypothetical protein